MRVLKLHVIASTAAIIVLLLTACTPSTPPPTEEPPAEAPAVEEPSVEEGPSATAPPPTDTAPPPTDTVAPPTDTPEATNTPSMPPDPIFLEVQTSDGILLPAVYYPPAVTPAPVVVLMHQVNMDGPYEWEFIAPWLQNRGLLSASKGWVDVPASYSPARQKQESPEWFRDPSWFPPVPDDLNVGVFYFTLRACQGSCAGFQGQYWVEDAASAIGAASAMPGIDPSLGIVAIGTSIGADGAVDGCALSSERTGIQCTGAMPVSPGSYLEMPFKETTETILEQGTKVLCFAAAGDSEAAPTCNAVEGDGYQKIIVEGISKHGIYLADPEVKPDLLESMVAFIRENTSQ